MYDPTIGRWTSEDPIGFKAGDPNLYRYVNNGPTNAIDPTGLYQRDVHFYLTYYLALAVGLGDIKVSLDDPRQFSVKDDEVVTYDSSTTRDELEDWMSRATKEQIEARRLMNSRRYVRINSTSAAFWIAWADQHVDKHSATEPIQARSSAGAFLTEKDPEKVDLGSFRNEGFWDIRNRFHFRHNWYSPTQAGSGEAAEPVDEAINDKHPDLMLMGIGLHAYQDSWAHEGYIAYLGHATAGTTPDEAWHDSGKKAMKMAKATYDKLRAFAEAQFREKTASRKTWEQVEDDIQLMLAMKGTEEERASAWFDLIRKRFPSASRTGIVDGLTEKRFLDGAGRVGRPDEYRPYKRQAPDAPPKGFPVVGRDA